MVACMTGTVSAMRSHPTLGEAWGFANPRPGRREGVQVIARAAQIMRLLADAPDGLTLSRLAAQVGLARSTVHRIVGAFDA